ncbi:TauD/TfdA family dioxygenase [Ralstonia pickettii]|nr:TauD/TfdA family dioxygenase [Ralstonia pickettii]
MKFSKETGQLSVQRLADRFVGEIQNFRISESTVAAHWGDIAQAYLDHKVLVLREQNITVKEFSAFGKIFGSAEEHHVLAMRHPEISTLTVLSNQSEIGRNPVMKYFGDGWHADSSYKAIPANATMLLGTEIPDEGGDTLFANVEAAFDDLPELMKAKLRTMRMRHQYRWSPHREDPWARWKFVGEVERRSTPEVVHPLVRKHPETGKETLHIAPRIIGSVIGVEGMDWDSSNALIDDLMGHITSEQYLYRHRWMPNDVIVWDNRCLLHSATTRELPQHKVRRLVRITTTGTPVVAACDSAGATIVVPDPEFA